MGKFDSTQDIYATHKFLTFLNIHKYFLLLLMYKCVTQYQGTHPYKLVNVSQNIRGNNVNFICPQFRTALFKNSSLCYGPLVWNTLPTEIKSLINDGNLFSFKRSLKTYLRVLGNN